MKQWITLSISAAMMFASCKKENLANSNTLNANGPAISARSADGSTYASGWEQSSSWNHYDSAAFRIYYMDRSTPEITGDVLSAGAVITYGKVSTTDPEYASFNQPMMLPFYFVPPTARPVKDAFYFFDRYTPGNARISYSTMAMDGSMPAGVSLSQFQFRYFVLSSAFLSSHNLTADMIRSRYNYSQLLNLLGIKE